MPQLEGTTEKNEAKKGQKNRTKVRQMIRLPKSHQHYILRFEM
ncbi:hypothetical protein ALP98_102825 [Pseudomonas viridiflava]|uniref:Uncharacterized protein n=3 Tax=Pseudomonas syringae group TaxID=136849 RepID=A0A3M4IS53_PSEVI|nr:Unknown protein sequence [Pseudomonas amygdali pv. morsprunorum]KPX04182.1 hypothetical protein ALO73_103034 [Pseudomonas syringae pv. daphniphylli]RMO99337.1 hypothetical protein ALQ30_102231 [Pseudomonas syringae pv. persicae]RMQ07150.1 hypothetical protein ALQ09_101967 [Pseudomonas viridiflava]RMQ72048.1 hypothetical protein ALP98_102825 [Pseudomonas viridiflava]